MTTQDEIDRQAFSKAWNDFKDQHEEWRFADREALLFQMFLSGGKHQREASAKELAESQAREAKLREVLRDCAFLSEYAEEALNLPKDHSALDSAISKAVENALREAAEAVQKRMDVYSNAGEGHPENSSARDTCFARANAALDIKNDILSLTPKPEKG